MGMPHPVQLLSGNESIARGAYEAGVTVGTGYPGTPSTEILQNLATYPGVYTEWSVNEKVALEVAMGASLAGARALVTMKHVGLNVAADPLFTASYIGVKSGLVIACADDPAMHSSQNEQDNRHYAYAAKVPMLDPADSQEAKDFTVAAFAMSEQYDTPVILRSTTRISHARSRVDVREENVRVPPPASGFQRNVRKYVMIPAYARPRHEAVEERMRRLAHDVETHPLNRLELRNPALGFIVSGICYQYVREVFPEASVLKLGIINPLPANMLKRFCALVERAVVVEELDPYLELRLRALGCTVEGKNLFPLTGELDADRVRDAFGVERPQRRVTVSVKVPPRPPTLCPGCPHRAVFSTLRKRGLTVTGDIGCYTLGALPPFDAMDTCVAMGAGVGMAQGIEIAEGAGHRHTTVAVLGDSTFAHSGITGLINAAYNGRSSLIIVLDNGTTAMTGMQPNPCSGERITGEPAPALDYVKLAGAVGIAESNVRIVDAYKIEEIEEAITALLESKRLSLLVVKGLCIILKNRKRSAGVGS